jgi:glycosyltransferase involved in cell wall biosynthesis
MHYPPPIHGSSVIGGYIKESKIINSAFECRYINLGTSASIKDIGKGSFQKLFRYLSIIKQVSKELITFRPNICYMTITAKGVGFFKDLVIISLVKLFGKKLIYHFHNKGIQENQNNYFVNRLRLYQFNNSRAILLSELLYYDLAKYLSKDKVFYCKNGIPAISDLKLDLLNLARKEKVVTEILFLSNMAKEKGVFVLLEACRKLFLKGISFKVYFIGAWSDISENQFSDFITMNNLQNNIIYVGAKYGNDKNNYFKQVDIFVHPTLNDCFPLVILEAMQYGLPVIATIEGAINEVVENNLNGLLVPKNNTEALADKIEYLINHPALRVEMGINGRKRFEERYSLEQFEYNFAEIMDKIAADFNLYSE